MEQYFWNAEKNEQLKAARGVSFEQVAMHIQQGDLLGVFDHPNRERYSNQHVLVVRIDEYAYLVPFVNSAHGRFLKTIIPSRKATRDFLEKGKI